MVLNLPTYVRLIYLSKVKTFERPLSVARWAQGDTQVRTMRIIIRDDLVRTSLYVAT